MIGALHNDEQGGVNGVQGDDDKNCIDPFDVDNLDDTLEDPTFEPPKVKKAKRFDTVKIWSRIQANQRSKKSVTRNDDHDKNGVADGEKQTSKVGRNDGGQGTGKDNVDVFEFVDHDLDHLDVANTPTRQSSSSQKQTPPQEYRARRQPEVESKWREIGGGTPEGDTRPGKKDLKVLEFLVHQLAKEEGKDLTKEQLKEDFFLRLVQMHGNVSGGSTRMVAFKSSTYPLRLWRDFFCVKEKTKSGKNRTGPHLFEYPQDKETPCRLCNQQAGEHISHPDQSVPELPSATGATQEERHECKSCGKQFKTRKTLNQHVKKVHAKEASYEKGEEDGQTGLRTVKDKKCERCGKNNVGDLQRHIKEFCRGNKDNLSECPHCKAMIVKSKLKEHMHGRMNKATGLMVKKGCEDKYSAGDDKPKMETCPKCLKAVKASYAPIHMARFHKGENLEKSKPKQEEVRKPVGQEKLKQVFTSREDYLAARETADIEEATKRSKEDLKSYEVQGIMMRRGLNFVGDRGFHLTAPPRFVPKDGNCSMSSVAMADNPGLGPMELHMEATRLRQESVALAVENIRTMDERSLDKVRLIATPETRFGEPAVYLTRENLVENLQRYAEDGEYAGNLGDIIPYVLAAYLRTPILLVDVNHANSPLGLFVSPRTLFRREPVTNVPYVMVRHQNHFEPLMVPEEARISLQEMFAAEEGPCNEMGSTTSCSNFGKSQGARGEQGGSGEQVNEQRWKDQESHGSERLAPPSSTQGDRKRLLSLLQQLPPQFEKEVRDLLKELDELYINSPSTVREMAESQQEIQVVFRQDSLAICKIYDQNKTGPNPFFARSYLRISDLKPFDNHS